MKLANKIAAATLSIVSLVACNNDQQPATSGTTATTANSSQAAQTDKLDTRFVTIGTGGASGPFNIIGTSLAEIYAKQFGVNSKTQTTGASVENLNLLSQGKLEIAMVMNDALSDAINGTGSFQQKVENVQTVATLYPNYVQIATSAKKGINSIDDLRGKRIAVGAQGSGVESSARALLAALGITYNDITPDFLGFAEAADGLKTGKLDAAFFTSGLPNSSLMELQQGFDLQIVPISADQVAQVAAANNIFVKQVIPQGTYGNTADIPTAAVMNSLVVRSDLSENDVYNLTKSFFDNLSALQTAHQAANGIALDHAQQGLIAPLHPGAQKYYAEASTK